ncbi:hypothetical protein PVK06_013547 [Gossypium arboreum]|uniref:Uncharacterized protein n=1 Tax=Gossypium arboreum TaxID=29729 RepID=A0ABR0PSF5_GOSAR|nr:hypothetical protein PVK06_013547 [Gossypium arboreum]
MAASSRKSSGPVLRSLSPSGRFSSHYVSHSPSSSSSAFAYSSSSFTSRSSTFFNQPRSISPPRVNVYNHAQSSQSVRFSLDSRPISPNRSISAVRRNTEALRNLQSKQPKRTCMCSPTTHPGSFRCSLHKGFNNSHASSGYAPSNRLNARRSAMTNSLVRIGGVEGDLVKRALSALIRPSSHQQRRLSEILRLLEMELWSGASDDGGEVRIRRRGLKSVKRLQSFYTISFYFDHAKEEN